MAHKGLEIGGPNTPSMQEYQVGGSFLSSVLGVCGAAVISANRGRSRSRNSNKLQLNNYPPALMTSGKLLHKESLNCDEPDMGDCEAQGSSCFLAKITGSPLSTGPLGYLNIFPTWFHKDPIYQHFSKGSKGQPSRL